MRYWVGIHILIVLGYFALAFVFWEATAMVWLSMSTGILCVYFRLELAALSRDMMRASDLWVVAIVLLCLGIFLVVLQFLLKELFWYLKGVFFGTDQYNIFWEFGRIFFVVTGVGVVWSLFFYRWVKVRSRYAGVDTLHTAFFTVALGSKFIKTVGLILVPIVLAVGMAALVGLLFVVIGGLSWAEIFGDSSVDLAAELEFIFVTGGLLLSFIPMYYLTSRWWSRDDLIAVLQSVVSE